MTFDPGSALEALRVDREILNNALTAGAARLIHVDRAIEALEQLNADPPGAPAAEHPPAPGGKAPKDPPPGHETSSRQGPAAQRRREGGSNGAR